MPDGPYRLPAGWRWAALGEVCQINPRRPRLYRDDDARTTFVPMNAVDEVTGTISAPQTRLYKEVRKGYTYFEEGDVLFAKITPCMENGKAAIARRLLDGIGFGSTEFHVLRPHTQVIAEWVWLFVRQESLRVAAKASFRGGVGQQRVPQEFLESRLIPLPPLAEQRHIVARLEELMAGVREARRLREEAKKDAERLMQAALAEAFPRPGTEPPPGWRWARLGDLCDRDATTIRPSDSPDKEFNYLGMEQVESGQWTEPVPARVVGSDIKSTVIVFRPGHVLYGKLRPYLNKVVVPSRPGIGSTEFVPILPHPPLIPEYLAAFLRTPAFVSYAKRNMTGSRQPRVRLDALWEALIPLSPPAEQRRIVAHLNFVHEKVSGLKESQSNTEAELQRLEQTILNKAFRGEL